MRVSERVGSRGAVVAGLLAAALLLVYPAVLGGKVLAPEDSLMFNAPLQAERPASITRPSNGFLADAVEVFHPDLYWTRETLQDGHLPLWDPNIFAGWPLLASQQTAMLYPLSGLAYVLPFWHALGIIIVLEIVLAAWGTWLLCRAFGLRPASAWLGAVSYAFGSYFVVWLEHPQTNVWLMLPFLLLGVRKARRGDQRAVPLLAAAVGFTLLGGHPESVFMVGLLTVCFAVVELARDDGDSRAEALGRLAGGTALGAVCGLVVLVPFVQQLGQSTGIERGGTNLPRNVLLTWFMPDLWGRPDAAFDVGGPVNYVARTLYFGALPLMLAAAGCYRSRRREQWFFIGAVVVALVIAISLPGLHWIVKLPILIDVQPMFALILVSFSLAMLAAFGFESFLEGDSARRRRMLAIAGVVAALPLAWAVHRSGVVGQLPRFDDLAPALWGSSNSGPQAEAAAVTRWIVAAGVGLVLLVLLARRWRPELVIVLVVLWCIIDLEALQHGFHPAVSESVANPPATPTMVAARNRQGHDRVVGLGEYLIPNVGERYGLRDARGHELPASTRFLSLWNSLGGFGFQATRLVDANSPTSGKLLDLFGVRLLLTGPDDRPALGQLKLQSTTADGRVYLNSTALPRAYVAGAWQSVPNRQAALAATLNATSAQLRDDPVVETREPSAAAPTGHTGRSLVHFQEDDPSRIKLRVSSGGGYLVLLDLYYPGWQADVDGKSTPILAANEAFRAVKIAPGTHTVDFRYEPRNVLFGGIASLLAWLAVVAALFVPARWQWRRRRGPRT
jgi:predicted membrane protein DUF2079/membrane protein YfhO